MIRRCLGCMEILENGISVCPKCGYQEGTPAEEAVHLIPGTILHDRYIIGKVLGFGGFGVTYIAWDQTLEQKVAIKEYLPNEFSTRMPGQSIVTIFSGDKQEQFNDGLLKFIDEAKRLAKFQNEPGIVKIFDSFGENRTAYIIMEYLEGETLSARLKREGKIPEDEAVKLIWPLLESLKVVHAEGIIHRDIAPDNIFLTSDGQIKLIDFGASRFATTSHSRSLTVIIKPGYSPEEQYRSRGDQGPHTDVYAMGAVLYKMITGKTPPDAMERRAKVESQKKEILEEPHKLVKDLSRNRENAILNAMNVRIEDRTEDVAAFMKELNADPPAKRRYGTIKKVDLFKWPLWLKVSLASVLLALITFGVLLATGVINFRSLFSSKVSVPDDMVVVPDIESMDKDTAIETLRSLKIMASTAGNVESEYVEPGKVVLQKPNAQSYVYEYGTVYLTISSGKGVEEAKDGISTVPYVVWDTKEDAIEKLKKAGLGEPEIIEVHDPNVESGRIISQDVEYGTKLEEGTKIRITVSLGPETFVMPSVIDTEKDGAVTLLQNLGLNVSLEESESSDIVAGNVISQSIAPGTTSRPGESVVLTISTGVPENTPPTSKETSTNSRETTPAPKATTPAPKETTPAPKATTPAPKETTPAPKETTPEPSKQQDTPKIVLVSYDGNGGSVSAEPVELQQGSTYGTMPSASRTGYAFVGWFTEPTGGTQITGSTAVTMTVDHTLYAQWTANNYTVTFNANSGSVSTASKGVTYDATYGDLPTPTRNYYSFAGWYTSASGGTKITSGTKVEITSDTTLYARWSQKPVKGPVLASSVPSGAQVVSEEWHYTRTQRTESESSSLSGWTSDGSYWKQTGSGSCEYASVPSGFNTGYMSFNSSGYSSYDNGSTKREVTNSWAGYVYWHWMYNCVYRNTMERAICDKKGNYGSAGYWYGYFYAFKSSTDYPRGSQGYVASYPAASAPPTYNCSGYMGTGVGDSNTDGRGTPRMLRFDYYVSRYTDYKKMYKYVKVTNEVSTTAVTAGGEISNVQKYVTYREK
ncbi:MAG: InlB B-repeat-containing protein [Clostridiales bacterium]|nr:InlB B-repeat-containing protein [Clostridiales bacterium]